MHAPRPSLERKSLERRAFEHYLRTGRKYYIDRENPALVQKNNPYHDPDNGQFTSGPSSGTGGKDKSPTSNANSAASKETNARSPKQSEDDKFKSRHSMKDVLSLVANSESSTMGSATISTGKGDRGGMSYGTFQFSTRFGIADDFVAENYKEDFQDADGKILLSGTPAFNAKWKEVVEREGEEFAKKEMDFAEKQYFTPAVRDLNKLTKNPSGEEGYNVSKSSLPVQQALVSTTVQHGKAGGVKIFRDALQMTERTVKRGELNFEEKLIENVYEGRKAKFRQNISDDINNINKLEIERDKEINAEEDRNKKEQIKNSYDKRIMEFRNSIVINKNVIKGRFVRESKTLIDRLRKENARREQRARNAVDRAADHSNSPTIFSSRSGG